MFIFNLRFATYHSCNVCNLVLIDAPPPLQPGLSEDELGGSEEVHQRSHQQSQRVKHRQHHSGAAAGKYRQGQVN